MPDDFLELLARDDKWALGAGDGTLFAPRFPLWLDAPGFWDEGTLHQYTVAPLFTIAFLDDGGAELPLTTVSRRWTPAELMVEYRMPGGVTASEVRTVQPGGVFASEWRLRALAPTTLHLVAWTMQDSVAAGTERVTWNGAIAMRRALADRWGVTLDVEMELACAGGAASWAAVRAERGAPQPSWRYTPFPVTWTADGLASHSRADTEVDGDASLYLALHRAVTVDGEGASATFALRVVPVDASLRTRADDGRHDEEAGSASRRRSSTPVPPVLAATLARASRQRWSDWLSRAPRVRCSDPYLEAWMRHRWVGMRLMATGRGAGEYARPLTCEGPGEWHLPAAASSAHLVRDLRWLRDAGLARTAVRAWMERVRDDGALPARLALQHVPAGLCTSADWGQAAVAVASAVPDEAWAARVAPGLARHAAWLEARALEALSRPALDARPGVVATLVADALGALAALDTFGATATGEGRGEALASRAAARLWDAGRGLFHEGDRFAVAGLFLYPWLPALDPQLLALERALSDPALFGTTYPLPTVAGTDREARVEPGVACRAADAVARVVTARGVARLRPFAGRLVRRVVHTFFADGDLRRPGAFEHYDAQRGHASTYRGWDDMQRAASADLVLQWLAGVRPHRAGITVDPLPAGIARLEVDGLRLRGRELVVRIDGEAVQVTVDGTARHAPLGTPIEIAD